VSERKDYPDEPEPGAEVIPLRAADAGSAVRFGEQGADAASYIDTTGAGGKRRDIIPESLARDRLPETLGNWAGRTWYQLRYHGLRLPWHVIWLSWLAHKGAWRLTCRLFTWANWAEGWLLESQAVAVGRAGHHEAMRAHTEGKKTRGARWKITGACAAAAAVPLYGLARYGPWWWPAPLAAAVFPVLVWHGRPEGRPIIEPAILPPAWTVPTPVIIRRGFGSLGIAKIDQQLKDGGDLDWVSDVHRDGDGWGVELDLPYGVTASDIIRRREALASGLRRPHSATWPEAVPHENAGRLYLWIGRHDLSKTKPVPYPLLKTGTADVFGQVPFAANPRGQLIGAPLFETNWVIGAAPGQGKTTAVRVLNCGAALDVVCDLWIHELAGAGDLEPLAQVCHRYVSGLDDESIAYAAASARKLRAEVDRRGPMLKALPREVRPDGKLTRELAAQRHLRLRPVCATFDEIQNAILHPKYGPQFVEDLAYVERLGRKLGIFLILSTQRPDGDALPPKIRDLATVRFCLKVPDQVSNDMILGTGSYKAGYRASEFRPKIDAGLGWFKGEDDPLAVRTHYPDLNATAKIAARARAMRQAAGVLSGYALGEDDGQPARSFAADVLSVFGADSRLWCETIAARLREHFPGVYADITPAAVASQLRAIEVTVKNVREPGRNPNQGCERAAVEAVAGMREAAGV